MRRRAVALMSVLVVLTLAALAGTSAMLAAEGSVAAAQGTLHRAQGRALAWSGVQAAMQEIAEQRDDLLLGGRPRLTGEWTLYTSGEGRGVVRLLAVDGEELAASECGKIDINVADEESLAKLPGVGKDLAAKIAAARKDKPFSSPEAMLRVDGVTPEMLLGAGDEEGGRDRREEAAPLTQYVTAFSFGPNVQCGVGEGGESHRGKLRINLNSGWSEDLGNAIEERFGQGAAEAVKRVMNDGAVFDADAKVVAKLIELKADPKDWAPILDAFTTTDEPYLLGRVDLLSASQEVLACVPGIDASAAKAIVTQREQVEDDERLSAAWPVVREILTPEQFQKAADHLTTRSMAWRVRVEAGVAPAGSDEREEPVLADRTVLEAVIDVSSRRARVAYLRDVTNLDAAMAMRERLPEPEEKEPEVEAPKPSAPGPGAAPERKRDEHFDLDPGSSKGEEPKAPKPDRNKDKGPDKKPKEETESPSPAAKKAKPAGSGPDRRTGRWTTGPKSAEGSP